MQFPVFLTCAKPIPCLAGIGELVCRMQAYGVPFHCWVSRAPEFKVSVLNRQHDENGVLLRFFPELKRFPPRSRRFASPSVHQKAIHFPQTKAKRFGFNPPSSWWPAGYGDQPLYTVFCEFDWRHAGRLLEYLDAPHRSAHDDA